MPRQFSTHLLLGLTLIACTPYVANAHAMNITDIQDKNSENQAPPLQKQSNDDKQLARKFQADINAGLHTLDDKTLIPKLIMTVIPEVIKRYFEPVIACYEDKYKHRTGNIFCAQNHANAIAYAMKWSSGSEGRDRVRCNVV
jgi:hypothetical protein